MANYTAYYLVLRAQMQIKDEAGVMISQEEILREVNAGQLAIVSIIPTAYSTNFVTQLVAGTRQNLPSDCLNILAPRRNMGSDGATPGRSIRIVSRLMLDSFEPGWHVATPSSTVTGIMYDENTPGQYMVYPPATAGIYIEMEGSFTPPIIEYDEAGEWQTAFLAIRDQYVEALYEFLIYRLYAPDSEVAANAEESERHYAKFKDLLGITPSKRRPPQSEIMAKGA